MQCHPTKRFSIFEASPASLGAPTAVRFAVDLQVNCKYSFAIVKAAINRRRWCTILGGNEKFDDNTTIVQIGDFENIEWESVMSGKQVASSYLVRKGLSRKAQLAMQIRRYTSKHPNSILKTATPFTLILETWNAFEDMRVDFGHGTFASFDTNLIVNVALRQRLEWCLEDAKLSMEDIECNHWILKSSVTNKGADIVIIKDWENLLDALEAVPDIREWVLQKYIANPLLLGGHKFHLRVYILCVGSLRVFVFEKILVLIAAHKYDINDTDNIYSHLTNTARSAEDIHFDERKFVKILEDLPQYLLSERPDIANNKESADKIIIKIKNDVNIITNELFKAFENEYTIFSPMNNCFEIFGLDFMVDENLNTTLLEVNPGPDFQQTGGRLKTVIEDLWDQTLEIVLDNNLDADISNLDADTSSDSCSNVGSNNESNIDIKHSKGDNKGEKVSSESSNKNKKSNMDNLNESKEYTVMEKATRDFTCVYSTVSSTSHLKGGMSFK